MAKFICLLAICLSAVVYAEEQRIAGGNPISIAEYPFAAVLSYTRDAVTFQQHCGGTILNSRSVLTAAHCLVGNIVTQIKVRVGSSRASSGGYLHEVYRFIGHVSFNAWNRDNDIAIVRVTKLLTLGNDVRPALLGTTMDLVAYKNVKAIGWGITYLGGAPSDLLRQVEIRTMSDVTCQNIYGPHFITANMVCAGWARGGRGPCAGDGGSALLADNVVVGVKSSVAACGHYHFPGVYTRLSRYPAWINTNA